MNRRSPNRRGRTGSRGFVVTLIVVLSLTTLGIHFVIKKPPDEHYLEYMEGMRDTSTAWYQAYPPDFEIELIDGETFRLSDAIGSRMVILNFFTTWCGPCRSEIPELQRYADEHLDDVLLVGIDVKESAGDARAFALRRGITYPVASDPSGKIADLYDVDSYPTTVVIGVQGRVQLHDSGAIRNADVAFGAILEHQREVLDAFDGITPEEFRRASSEAGHPSGRVPTDASEVRLEGRALELANRIRCPSCGERLIECDGETARKIRGHLAALDVDSMTDAEVLEALFLIPEEER